MTAVLTAVLEGFPAAVFMWLLETSLVIGLVVLLDRTLLRRCGPEIRGAVLFVAVLRLAVPPGLGIPVSTWPGLDTATSGAWAFVAGEPETARALAASSSGGAAVLGPWLVAAWALGALVAFASIAARRRRFEVALEQMRVPASELALRQLARAARRAGLARPPALVVMSGGPGPAALRGRRGGRVLCPATFLAQANAEELAAAFLHEATHLRRRDPLRAVVWQLVHALLWFHPLLPLLRRRAHALRELACDAAVARRLRGETPAYREALRACAARLLVRPAAAVHGVATGPSVLLDRLRWLDGAPWRGVLRRRAIGLTLGAILAGSVLPAAAAGAQAPTLVTHPIADAEASRREPGCLRERYRAIAAYAASLSTPPRPR